MNALSIDPRNRWPTLSLSEWRDTYRTLHMWTQIVGKVRLALTPLINHWWEVPLYVNSFGLTTSPIPFEHDTRPGAYDPEYVHRFWQVLISVYEVFLQFRAGFVGKASPIHFFWGSFDFAVTRFSGRPAPIREGADPITREAYSHEVISAGFWPGSGEVKDAAFYVYAAPEPNGFSTQPVRPEQAFYHPEM